MGNTVNEPIAAPDELPVVLEGKDEGFSMIVGPGLGPVLAATGTETARRRRSRTTALRERGRRGIAGHDGRGRAVALLSGIVW